MNQETKTTAFTGIQPSGELHLGNYLGAVKNWIRMAHSHDLYTCIVDYHALTNPMASRAENLEQRSFDLALSLLAAGLDGEKTTLFVQSHVPEVTEITWIFLTLTPLGELERMTQFKDKSAKQESILSGLLTYPVLQAADILIYKAREVPVGEDQIQHIELTREVARKFNNAYGETFPEPTWIVPKLGGRIRGLDGDAKMSKSMGNTIGLLESAEESMKKLRSAVTDPARIRRSDPGNPDVCNIFTLHKNFSDDESIQMVDMECRRAGIGCVDCKKLLHTSMEKELAPIRERAETLRQQPDQVNDVLRQSAQEAQLVARETLQEVREKVGFMKPLGELS